jgi:hypothetical protein
MGLVRIPKIPRPFALQTSVLARYQPSERHWWSLARKIQPRARANSQGEGPSKTDKAHASYGRRGARPWKGVEDGASGYRGQSHGARQCQTAEKELKKEGGRREAELDCMVERSG